MHLIGIAAAPGIAVGPIWRPRGSTSASANGTPAARAIPAGPPPDPGELAAAAARQLQLLAQHLRDAGRTEEAGVFDAQALMATDPTLIDDWRRRIEAHEEPAAAIRAAASAVATAIAALGDELLAARSADVRDVGERLARLVTGEQPDTPSRPSIAIADDLSPSATAEIPPSLLLGIALEAGSRTAHAAILARSLGIPCVVGVAGLGSTVDRIADGPLDRDGRRSDSGSATVAVDGTTGEVYFRPTADELAMLRERARAAAARDDVTRAFRDRPCETSDGWRITLLANIGGPADVDRALAARAEGVGLFRTEFLFMGHQTEPTEREQADAYRRVFEAFGRERQVVVRLADIGGDKGIPYLSLPTEANPFLGVRALRLAYRDRALLVTQIRAISTAAAAGGVVPRVMAPMVAALSDVELLDELVDEAQSGLAAAGRPRADRLIAGIMVEIPSAALIAGTLAHRVGFFSIGTNDLTQYVMAADRTNASLASFQDALHPAVLRCIAMVVDGAAAAGIPVAVCGELAGDPAGALVLAGLGIRELSADAGAFDALRYHFASVTRSELTELAQRALAAPDAATVRSAAEVLLQRTPRVPGVLAPA